MADVEIDFGLETVTVNYTNPTVSVETGVPSSTNVMRKTVYDAAGKQSQVLVETDLAALGFDIIADNDSARTIGSNSKAFADGFFDRLNTPAIKFPSTQIASSNANTLDDYEEGSWVGVPAFGGASTGITGTFNAEYVKVGQLCFISFFLAFTSNGTGTGACTVGGLPFASSPATRSTLNAGYWSGLSGVVGNPIGFIDVSATSMSFLMSGATGHAAMTDTNIPDGAILIGSGVYRTV